MLIFFMKLLGSIRKAIAGRKHPHQLAWAFAFGLLLGIIPHGNLLALAVLVIVLTLKVNHAMAGLTAIGVSFAATRLDPYSHQLGDLVLSHPDAQGYAASAWQLPLMPWTDLNNTVVLGSLMIGVAALIPAFAMSYPVFRFFAPEDEQDEPIGGSDVAPAEIADESHRVVLVDQGHKQQVVRPHRTIPVSEGEVPDFKEIEVRDDERPPTEPAKAEADQEEVAVETRIDVIRLRDVRAAQDKTDSHQSSDDTRSADDQPTDEALNYLLRQLRDSQSRKTA